MAFLHTIPLIAHIHLTAHIHPIAHIIRAITKMKRIDIKLEDDLSKKTLEIDLTVINLNSVKQAAYKFTDLCSFIFEQKNKRLFVTINFLKIMDQNEKEDIVNKLYNEILDQDLRQIIADETEHVRNLILANAFSNSELIEPDEL